MTSRRVAVIGGGVSGLTAGYLLARANEVTVFEADDRLGGHAHTHHVAAPDGTELAVDSGFIVCNEQTYPLLTKLFEELGVTTQEAEMSMSVRCAGCGLEYAGHRGLSGLLAGIRRGRRRYVRMLGEILRFHREASRLIAGGHPARAADLTLGQFLAEGGYSRYFTAHFALPFVSAVWSCPPGTALDYPAGYLFPFLANHGLLSVTGSPRWRTVTGGSQTYVDLIAKQLTAIHTGAPVRSVSRHPGGAEITTAAGRPQRFDAVVIATHPDQALRLLADPTAAERRVLGAFRYTRNAAVLHTDASVLPASPRARASWNYHLSSCDAAAAQVRVSYDMNRLQRLPAGRDYLVTLNAAEGIDRRRVLAEMDYAHPAYTRASVAAQQALPGLNDGVTGYAGAYHGWGFHEDGCRSGVAAAASLGSRW
jgi:predicted NAD/FAD-binding protein